MDRTLQNKIKQYFESKNANEYISMIKFEKTISNPFKRKPKYGTKKNII